MSGFTGELTLSRLDRVISGPGKLGELGAVLDQYGRRRVVVVTGRTLRSSTLVERLADALGERRVSIFAGARQHVPSCSVQELVSAIDASAADCLVSFGGGSPIDAAKAAIHAIRLRRPPAPGDGHDDALLHVAIPTTLSAGEFTAIAGVTDEATRIKRGVSAPYLAPRTVIADPTVTLETPAWLWAATGIRALDHAVESLYSVRHHPFCDALASKGIALLVQHLPRSLAADATSTLEHRSHCQMAAWMSVFGLPSAGFGLSHALGHQIGPRWDVPHGITSCITLPHAMRFMAEMAPDRFGPIAEGLGVPFDPADPKPAARACADRTERFIAQFGLPQRLRDVQVPRDQIDALAGIVHDAVRRSGAVDREVSGDELRALLARAY